MIKTIEVAGIGPAIHAMRNPYDSWNKSDTHRIGRVGPKDAILSNTLAKSGPEHAKHLRMCMVWAEIYMPLYWWKEFDTYRAGVEKLSCSTMHMIHSRPLEVDDFKSVDPEDDLYLITEVLPRLNGLIENYKKADKKDKTTWKKIIADLPQSYIQRRTVMMSYATIRSIYNQRRHHRLTEWEEFRKWTETLPESWMITGYNLPQEDKEDEDSLETTEQQV